MSLLNQGGELHKATNNISAPRADVEVRTTPVERALHFELDNSIVIEQHKDPGLRSLLAKAISQTASQHQANCFYFQNKVLMRKWRPLEVPANQEWMVHHQIVIPTKYRNEILHLAHETPLSGHQGITKTYEKILSHFFWPGLKADVVKFCNSCHVCQVVGKPNQTIPVAPLQPIPAMAEPFSHVLIDCVGPLSKTLPKVINIF